MKLTGSCNFCGACCTGNDGSVCENLQLVTAIGMPNASFCRKYKERYNGMPIVMIAKDGSRIENEHYCGLNSPEETRVIIEKGIERGVCSLKLT